MSVTRLATTAPLHFFLLLLTVLCTLLTRSTASAADPLSPVQEKELGALLADLAGEIEAGSITRILAHLDDSVPEAEQKDMRAGLKAEFAGYRYARVRFACDPRTDVEWTGEEPKSLEVRTVMHCAYAPLDEAERSNDPGQVQKFRLSWDGQRFRMLSADWLAQRAGQNEKTFFPLLFWWGTAVLLGLFFWVASTLYVAERTRNFTLVTVIFLLPVVGVLVYFLIRRIRRVLKKSARR